MKKANLMMALAAVAAMVLSASCDIWPRGPYTTPVTGVTLDKTTLEMIVGDSDVKLTATVAPENASDKSVSWSSDKPEVATVDQEGNVSAVAIGTATITVTTTDGGKTAVCTVTVAPDYVTIGGLRWAKCNIGAAKETDYGYYFFWGGTEGYVYDSANSKWVKASDGSELSGGFTWSNTPFNNGSTEYDDTYFKNVMDTECPGGVLASKNDAAAVYRGAGWRMPTVEDFTALANACKEGGYTSGTFSPNTTVNPSGAGVSVDKGIYWCTGYDGVAGLLFCDGTNRLFFPAARYGYNTSLSNACRGDYWSSSLHATYMTDAYGLGFHGSDVNPRLNDYRYYGQSVRPVSDIN